MVFQRLVSAGDASGHSQVTLPDLEFEENFFRLFVLLHYVNFVSSFWVTEITVFYETIGRQIQNKLCRLE